MGGRQPERAEAEARRGGRAVNDLNLVRQFMARVAAPSCPELMKCIEKESERRKENLMERTDPYILVQGPAWGDAQFYGEWLLAAAKAEACRSE
jgi:hypothetical protein